MAKIEALPPVPWLPLLVNAAWVGAVLWILFQRERRIDVLQRNVELLTELALGEDKTDAPN